MCLSTNGERACLVRLYKSTIVLYDVFYLKMLLFHGDCGYAGWGGNRLPQPTQTGMVHCHQNHAVGACGPESPSPFMGRVAGASPTYRREVQRIDSTLNWIINRIEEGTRGHRVVKYPIPTMKWCIHPDTPGVQLIQTHKSLTANTWHTYVSLVTQNNRHA